MNVLGSPCEGCQYHTFPYVAEIPVIIDGKREKRTFTCKEDVWDIVNLIVSETEEVNRSSGRNFDVTSSVLSQAAFFTCTNVFFDQEIQNDLQRYIYCESFGVQPYNGSYGDQPFEWVRRSFIIKKALAKKEGNDIDGSRKNNNTISA